MTIQEFLQRHDGHAMTLEVQTGKRYGKLTTTTATVTNLDLLAAAFPRQLLDRYRKPIAVASLRRQHRNE